MLLLYELDVNQSKYDYINITLAFKIWMVIFMLTIFQLFILIITGQGVPDEGEWDYELQRIESINETGDLLEMNYKVKRINRTHYGISGYASTSLDILDGSYDGELVAFVSATGSSQYTLSPIRVPRSPMCKIFDSFYRKYLMKPMKPPVSNFPFTDDEDGNLCTVEPHVNYTLDNYNFDKALFPKKMRHGLYKIWLLIWQDVEVLAGFQLIVKVFPP